jgi:anti-sigma factor RsiW
MNCWRVQSLLAPFVEGELPDDDSVAVARHIEACGPCRDAVEAVASVPEITPPALPDEHRGRIGEALERCVLGRVRAAGSGTGWSMSAGPVARQSLWALQVRVPVAAAAAAAIAFLGLSALHLGTQRRLAVLEAEAARREATVQALQAQIASESLAGWRLANLPAGDAGVHWTPIEVDATGLPASSAWAPTLAAGTPGQPPYQLVSTAGPRVMR